MVKKCSSIVVIKGGGVLENITPFQFSQLEHAQQEQEQEIITTSQEQEQSISNGTSSYHDNIM